jgi:hypothetical protein
MTESIDQTLLPNGPPSKESRDEFLRLYELMVRSSEDLVNRRQTVNTFFLTANGVMTGVVGLFLRGDASPRLKAAGVLALVLAGATLAYAWRSLLASFGQLNAGKFAIINRMERHLAAAIYEAEWQALGRGENPKVYKSFTSRERIVPSLALLIYAAAAIVSGLVMLGVFEF